MKIKKLIMVLTVFTLLLVFAGCGNGDSDDAITDDPQAETAESVEDGSIYETKNNVYLEENEECLLAKLKCYEVITEEGVDNAVEDGQEMEIENAVDLCSFLECLDYHPYTNDGLPEYSITFDDGTIYDINLSSGWVWKWAEEEAKLTGDLLQELRHFCK